MADRDVRYQAAVVRDGRILLIHCTPAEGTPFWLLPGGGREDEDEAAFVEREVREETHLDVRVERLLYEMPALPGDMYARWRTYLCAVIDGREAPGIEPEGAAGDMIDAVRWLDLGDEAQWRDKIRTDIILAPQLRHIRSLLGLDGGRG